MRHLKELLKNNPDFQVLVIAVMILAGSLVLNTRPLRSGGELTIGGPGGIPLPVTCVARRVFDIPCPACGLTRSITAISHGDFQRAWAFSRVGYLAYMLLLFQIPYRSWRLSRRGKPTRRIPKGISLAIAAVFAANWIYNLVTGRLAP